jgi:hypothetical protein
MSFWTGIPEKPGNNLGGCRVTVKPPAHLRKKDVRESRTSIIKDLLAKKRDIKFRAKTLNLGLTVKILTHLVSNIVPPFLFNQLAKPRRVLTYMMTNVRGLPVTFECMGLTMDKMHSVPPFLAQVFGKHHTLK